MVRSGNVQMVVNTPTKGKVTGRAGFRLRRLAAEYKVPCLTSLDTARAMAGVLQDLLQGDEVMPVPLDQFTEFLKDQQPTKNVG
ncbi:hypothetical protein N752_10530 [Desulforamulus aquiferis]|nr:hypothetical protein N752_10530 [Desulforamulus aquiferis]